jgi:hypothetical protein
MKCFVIMPFSKTNKEKTERYWSDHFSTFLKPKIESVNGLIAERSKPLRGDILKEIITNLISSEIVVADLTDLNPNVFYELGIRQSFKHGTITIAEYGTKLPFDVKNKGVLFYYPKDHIKNAEFEEDFLKSLKDCFENICRPDSVVLESIQGRGSLYELFQLDEIKRRLSGLSFEFMHNNERFIKLIKEANSKTNNKKQGFSTTLFRYACIELLISQRYLSEESKLYEISEKYYSDLLSLNARLIDWPSRENTITKWFLTREKPVDKNFTSFRTELARIGDKIKSKK